MQEIIDWLNSEEKDYQVGISLLEKSGFKNRVLLNNLRNKESARTRDKLNYELSKIAKVPYTPLPEVVVKVLAKVQEPKPSQEEKEKTAPVANVASKPDLMAVKPDELARLTPELQEDVKTVYELTNKARQLSEQMKETPEGEELKKVVDELEETEKQIESASNRVQYFFQHGELPLPPGFNPDEQKKERSAENELANARSRLSNAKKALALDPGNSLKKEKFDKETQLVNELALEVKRNKEAADNGKQ